ncbi:MAG: hypothetical protein Unbinned3205contig1001_42 [Prokaryotic dsDNA virus sp.]|nr:MAG: hypothetical protein Unbinned3205contig1001_42 [Prokaryotic dsDNA virus sp.]|tara:strand:- start:1682 stop:2284 length:603 start_codon:yes stop_codon:yes gene_type:complete
MKKSFELLIPTEWSEISIKQYTDYIKSVTENDSDEDYMSNILLNFCGVKSNMIKYFKVTDLQKIKESLDKLISSPINTHIIHKIKIDGVKYGFHPNLDEMTMGEFIDLDTHAKNNDMSKMMNVLYRPITKEEGNRYDIESYSFKKHGDNYLKFQNLSINIANAVAVFFWTLGSKLLTSFQTSSNQMDKKAKTMDSAGLRY